MSFSNNTQVGQGSVLTATVTAFSLIKAAAAASGVGPTVDLAGANDEVMGASPEYDNLVGVMMPYAYGGVAQVKLGGPVAAGGDVISDGSGHAVAAATTGTVVQNLAGIALMSGVSGDIIPVRILPMKVRPALT